MAGYGGAHVDIVKSRFRSRKGGMGRCWMCEKVQMRVIKVVENRFAVRMLRDPQSKRSRKSNTLVEPLGDHRDCLARMTCCGYCS
jgi:hypothetical protein